MPFVWAWKVTEQALIWMRPVFERIGYERSSTIVHPFEEAGKHLFFNCQGCGQCLLHYTGMTCPMNCPKSLRNGPCGGVRANGKCEVKPEMDCVWVKGYERSQKTPYAHEFYRLNPPVDWRVEPVELVRIRRFLRALIALDPYAVHLRLHLTFAVEPDAATRSVAQALRTVHGTGHPVVVEQALAAALAVE